MQFAGLNNKRFYFYYGIASLPFGHLLLEEVRKEKKDLEKSIHQVINEKKIELLKTEASTVRQCERLRVLRSVLLQLPIHYKLDSERLQRNYKYYHEKLYFKLKLVMIIFGLLIGILTYVSTKYYLRWTVSKECFDWKNSMRKSLFCTKTNTEWTFLVKL